MEPGRTQAVARYHKETLAENEEGCLLKANSAAANLEDLTRVWIRSGRGRCAEHGSDSAIARSLCSPSPSLACRSTRDVTRVTAHF